MELEKQVTSLELSKKLKELGVKQESITGWRLRYVTSNDDIVNSEWVIVTNGFIEEWVGDEACSAFTVAELLDMCPASTTLLKRTDLETKKIPRYYAETFEHYRDSDSDENPANALARMLIQLIENKLI